jgi:hypothetical protein
MAKRAKLITNDIDTEVEGSFDFGKSDRSSPDEQIPAPTSSPQSVIDTSLPLPEVDTKMEKRGNAAAAEFATFENECLPVSPASQKDDSRLAELKAATALSALIAAEGDALEIRHPHEAGEEYVALGSLHRWHSAPSELCDFLTPSGQALLERAINPDLLPPVTIAMFGNALNVVDNFHQYDAILLQHGENPEQLVRVIRFQGTEPDALLRLFHRIFLNQTLTDIDRAAQMAATKIAFGFSNLSIAAALGWTASKVTKWVTAGMVATDHATFFDLLDGRRPKSIDYGYKVAQALQTAARKDRDAGTDNEHLGALLEKRDALLAEDERFDAPAALAALGIGPSPKIAAEASPKPIVAVSREPFETPEGRNAGAVEILSDGIPRLRFPTVESGLARDELAIIREVFMAMAEAHIERHLFQG